MKLIGTKELLSSLLQVPDDTSINEHSPIATIAGFGENAYATDIEIDDRDDDSADLDGLTAILTQTNFDTYLVFAGSLAGDTFNIDKIFELSSWFHFGGKSRRKSLGLHEVIESDAFSVKVEGSIYDLCHNIVEAFDTQVNQSLEDPFVVADNLPNEELRCTRGSVEDYTKVAEAIVILGRTDMGSGAHASLVSGYDSEPASLCDYDIDNISRAGIKALLLALEVHRPYGCRYEYNDGHGGRLSGYSPRGEEMTIAIDAPSAIETAQALETLEDWMTRFCIPDTRFADKAREILDELVSVKSS